MPIKIELPKPFVYLTELEKLSNNTASIRLIEFVRHLRKNDVEKQQTVVGHILAQRLKLENEMTA